MTPDVLTPIDLSDYIEMRDERPYVRGRRLPVVFVAVTQRASNATVAELADRYTLSEEQVLAALLYYREHQAVIDAQFEADSAESAALHEKYHNKPGQR
jgi:uncharacterized protein (DUF433 family)